MAFQRIVEIDNDELTDTWEVLGDTLYQTPEVSVSIEGEEFRPTSVKVETDRYTAAGMVETKGLFDGNTPATGGELTADINSERVFTGTVNDISRTDEGLLSITAFDAIKTLAQTSINQTFDMADMEFMTNHIAQKANIDAVVDIEWDMCLVPDYLGTKSTTMLNQIAKWSGKNWWIDAENTLHMGDPEPTVHQFSEDFIKAAPSVGDKEIPYNKVVVYGQSPTSQSAEESDRGGDQTQHMISKENLRGEAGDGDNVYRYESKQIVNQRQANIAAQAILDEFQMQRASGSVPIVGEGAPVRPLDVIEMPSSYDNERYMVSSLTHRFNNDDGFITDVQCGGLIDGYVDGVPIGEL